MFYLRKKIILMLIPILGLQSYKLHAITTESAKTVLQHTSLPMAIEPLMLGFRDFVSTTEAAERFSFSASPFYVNSLSSKQLRQQVMPEGKDILRIRGSEAGAADVSATWLKIVGHSAAGDDHALMHNGFASDLTVEPKYSMYGASFAFHKKIGRFFLQCSTALVEAKADIGLREAMQGGQIESIDFLELYDPAGGGGFIENPNILFSASAKEAFNQSYWRYGKLGDAALKASGLSDVNCRVGVEGEHGELFLIGVLPLSKRKTNEHIFEPQLGNGSHLGLGAGVAAKFAKNLEKFAAIMQLRGEFDATYLFENDQVRTFDLKDKGEFSRYLLFKTNSPARGGGSLASNPGVNVLSKKCAIEPGAIVHTGLQLNLAGKKLFGSLGYHLQYAQQEKIRLKEGFGNKQIAIAHTSGDNGNHPGDVYYPEASISIHGDNQVYLGGGGGGAFGDPLTVARLDLNSATKPSLTMSSGVVSVGFQENIQENDTVRVAVVAGIHFDHAVRRLDSWLLGLQGNFNF